MPLSLPTLVESLAFPSRDDESARGLIMRVAEDNFCTSTEISTWLGLTNTRSTLHGDIHDAAARLGIPAERFAAMGLADGHNEAFLNHWVPSRLLLRRDMAVCPACLAEEPYHRRVWDHVQLKVCPHHRIELVRVCATCASEGRTGTMAWCRSDMLHCSKGHPLVGQPVEAAPAWRGHAAVYRYCGIPCEGPDFPEALQALPLQALLDLLSFFGRMELVVARGNPAAFRGAGTTTDARVLETGAEIALGWPDSFNGLANGVRAAQPSKKGLSRRYDRLHRFVHGSVGQPYENMLKEAYATHLASQADISDRAFPEFLVMPSTVGKALQRVEAAEALGLGHRAFRSLMESELWNGFTPLLRGVDREELYLRDEVMALRRKLDRLVTPSTLSEHLGLGRGKGKQMADAGLLPVYGWNRHSKRNETRSICLSDADELFGRVVGAARLGAPVCLITFTGLLNRVAARRVVEFPDMMRALLSGALPVWITEADRSGFASLGFEEDDVVRLLDRLAGPEASGKICLGDVARRLGIAADGVHALVGAGLLPEPDRKGGLVFEVDAILAFEASYFIDHPRARKPGVSCKEFRTELAGAGRKPLLTVSVRNSSVRAEVYPRRCAS